MRSCWHWKGSLMSGVLNSNMPQRISDTLEFSSSAIIPDQGTWIGRAWLPDELAYRSVSGPHSIMVSNGEIFDLSEEFNTTSELLNQGDPLEELKRRNWPRVARLSTVLDNSLFFRRDPSSPYILSPNDIQAIKACGVTFIQSLLERVIEEKAKGDPGKSREIREIISANIGTDLSGVEPGSPESVKLKREFQAQGVWSPYLEVGIGKDAEVFTKAQPLSAVSFGAEVGVLQDSSWNNPEPEVVLAVSTEGKIRGATLGNDVNLRDYEGRSALLLGEAKDQNGSCSIGPFIRLFDESFSLEDVKKSNIRLSMHGVDGFVSEGMSAMSAISRRLEDLVAQTLGRNHQYPDGLMLFTGTMFAPTMDRDKPGEGFTHHVGDRVEIETEMLGKLVNWVNYCSEIPPWTFGIHQFNDFTLKRHKGVGKTG